MGAIQMLVMDAVLIKQLVRQKKIILDYPDKLRAVQFIEQIFGFLFLSPPATEGELTETATALINRLSFLLKENNNAEAGTSMFFSALPELYNQLIEDAHAILAFDPAANDLSEVLIAYPGFYATVAYRLSHQLWWQGYRLLPRLISEYAHSKTGIDIHPGASIGSGFAIDHGTGIVIGETSVVGNNVKIYQGVTLGALNVDKAQASSKRHPTIENNVVIYSNATILGGNTVVGEGSIIGGNVWLTQSVPPNSIVYHKSEVRIKGKEPFSEPLNFII